MSFVTAFLMAYEPAKRLSRMRVSIEGGMIGVDANGNAALIFNSAGMYRAMQNSKGDKTIGIYKD